MKENPESASLIAAKIGRNPERKRRAGTRARNIILALFLLPILVILLGGGLLLYFFQGQEISNETVNLRVQQTLQTVLGDDFSVAIESTGLSLISTSAISLEGDGVVITKKSDGSIVANLDEVEVGLNIVSVLQGTPRFDIVSINGGQINLTGLARPQETSPTLKQRFSTVGKAFQQLEKPFRDKTIRKIQATNLTVSGVGLGRKKTGDLVIDRAQITLDKQNLLNVNADLASDISLVNLNVNWRGNLGGGKQLSIGAGGVNALEWFETSEVRDENLKGFGLDALLRIDARIPFSENLEPVLPFVKLQTAGASIRLGPNETRRISSAVVNLQFSPDDTRLELLPSDLIIGEKNVRLEATILPANPAIGLSGPLEFELVSMSSEKSIDADKSINQSITINGKADRTTKEVRLAAITVKSGDEKIDGSLNIGFGETSPSLKGSLSSALLSPETLLNAWPFHIAPNVQTWISDNISAGQLSGFDLVIDVAQGRLKEVTEGKGFTDSEFQIDGKLDGISVNLIGDLPQLQNASGDLSILGSKMTVWAEKGILKNGGNTVSASAVKLEAPNLFIKSVPSSLQASLSGKLSTIAALSNLKPLNIAKTLALNPADLSGDGEVKLSIDFDLQKTDAPTRLDWSVDLDLIDAASKSEIFGRKISNANLKINATPKVALISGAANVDGFDTKLELTEPLLAGASQLRKRNISARVNHEDLAKQGINLAPVVKGVLDVEISSEAGKNDIYEIDLTNTDVNLPWISWLKGKGIAAKAKFALTQKDGVNTLSDFKFSGEGFNADGKLVFDKGGLISLNLQNVSLIGRDRFDVSATKEGNRLNISAQGKGFDARAIINMVIHKSGLNAIKGSSDVSLSANFGQMNGFNNQVMENALVNYRTDNGRLSRLEIRGAMNGKLSKIDARRQGDTTTFDFDASDAGASLAMVNIYNKMREGRLKAKLTRNGNGPFVGDVKLRKFTVIGEDRLSSLTAAPVTDRNLQSASGQLRELNLSEAPFDNMEAIITKSPGYLGVKSGRIRNSQIGLTFDGVVFDQQKQMNVRGTFMPLFAVSRVIGAIPIIGDILSNGKNSGLIGITYRLRGAANNPQISVNPLSLMAPGVFKQIFQFQE